MRLRLGLFLVGLAVAGLVSWLAPRLSAPPDRQAVALRLLDEGRAAEAAHLFRGHGWRGVAEYRAGRYRRALGEFLEDKSIAGFYNMGNAYARLHEWSGAKEAYRRALDLDPDHADARHNLAVVERAEAAEERAKEAARRNRRMGRWRDGNRTVEDRNKETGGKAEKGDAAGGEQRPASSRQGVPGESERAGRLGQKPVADNDKAGRADARSASDVPSDLKPGASGTAILRESAQDAEILLRRIKDDPRRVLAARLMASHRKRTGAQ